MSKGYVQINYFIAVDVLKDHLFRFVFKHLISYVQYDTAMIPS